MERDNPYHGGGGVESYPPPSTLSSDRDEFQFSFSTVWGIFLSPEKRSLPLYEEKYVGNPALYVVGITWSLFPTLSVASEC